MSEEVSATSVTTEVKKVKKVVKKKKSVTIDDKISIEGERRDSNTQVIEVSSLDQKEQHFSCWKCEETLSAKRYVLKEEHPYCLGCYENVFSNQCYSCKKTIGVESRDLSYKDRHWHEACFNCVKCNVTLVEKTFGAKDDLVYCADCYDQNCAPRCDSCTQPFKAGMKRMEYKGKMFHEGCFVCNGCKKPIGTNSFVPKDEAYWCTGCYEETFSTRCSTCKKIIVSGGVTYKNEPYHKECFTCTECKGVLAGTRFTNRDNKPFCQDCFGKLFAKKCSACEKPITGAGGVKFITFEDRNWHNECFNCTGCKSTLVGKGFITDGPEIICPDCAKTKLA